MAAVKATIKCPPYWEDMGPGVVMGACPATPTCSHQNIDALLTNLWGTPNSSSCGPQSSKKELIFYPNYKEKATCKKYTL